MVVRYCASEPHFERVRFDRRDDAAIRFNKRHSVRDIARPLRTYDATVSMNEIEREVQFLL